MRDDNAFFAAVAKEHPRGYFPRYLLGEQSYWTILGGTSGEEEEALFSEDGAIEAGNARFSIEPFLKLDGKPVSWNDVEIEQREGPQVVWKKHLTITPRYENGTLRVRYQAAPNARLVLAIRPFQVNPQWQFLNRTGGVVRIKSIRYDDTSVTVEADTTKTIRVSAPIHLDDVLPESHVAGDYKSLFLEFDETDVTIEIPLGAALSTRHPALSTFSLDLPAEPRLAQTIAAQLRYILINKDGPAIHPGSRSYERSWIRDGSLTSEALLRLGQDQVVREFIEWYARAIRKDGYVPCCVSAAGADPVPEHDSHGQFIYLVAEYYRHTGDRALVDIMWPTIEKVVAFIDKLRHERMTKQYEGTAFYGLVPESISHEGYSARAMHSYWDDLFILKGLEDAAFLAGVAGERRFTTETQRTQRATEKTSSLTSSVALCALCVSVVKRPLSELVQTTQRATTANRYATLHAAFRKDLLASIELAMKQHNIAYIPGSVELGDFDATSTTVAVTPVDAELPAAALQSTFEKYWQHALEPRTYTPYELRVVGTLVRLGQAERARQLLEYFFADQRPAAWSQWAEVVRANPREGGFIGDMPHTWVGSDFIRSALDFLAYEDDDALIVGAGLSREWAERGVRVRGLSTHYGTLDYSIEAAADGLRMHIGGDLRVPKNGIVVKSPYGAGDVVVRSLPAELVLKDAAFLSGGRFTTETPRTQRATEKTLSLTSSVALCVLCVSVVNRPLSAPVQATQRTPQPATAN
jgi:hypothetical protein